MTHSEQPSEARTHTRVASVRGPEFCCQECSLATKTYVEWPCPARFLLTMALLGLTDGNAGSPSAPTS